MKAKDIDFLNELVEEKRDIEHFISIAGYLKVKLRLMKSVSWGSYELEVNKSVKNKVIKALKERLSEINKIIEDM